MDQQRIPASSSMRQAIAISTGTETLLFFQLTDRFSLKETGSIVLTSNKDTSQWKDLFEEDDALECTIDRLWDEALCYTFTGRSYRGKNQEFVSLDFLELKN